MSEVERIPATEWKQWASTTEGTILDVREPSEWALGTLPGALLISIGQLLERLDEVDVVLPVLVVCRSGSRSLQVATYLAASGYTAANLDGGLRALGMQT
jgi:rhodanese-related sulfurtransferase